MNRHNLITTVSGILLVSFIIASPAGSADDIILPYEVHALKQ